MGRRAADGRLFWGEGTNSNKTKVTKVREQDSLWVERGVRQGEKEKRGNSHHGGGGGGWGGVGEGE